MAVLGEDTARRDSGITLNALRVFVAIVDAGSFSKAAIDLGTSQPSISAQLSSLERAVKVLLLRRRPRLEVTEAGRELLVRARLIIARLDEFECQVSALHALARGQLSVGLSGPHVAMRLIASFLDRHPGIALSTRVGNTSALLADVAQCRIDVGIVAMDAPVATLACTRIFDLRLAVCLPRDHALAGKSRIVLAQLADAAFIQREEGSVTRSVAERLFAAAGFTPSIRLEVTGREAMKEAVVAGLGIGLLFAHEGEGDQRLACVILEPGQPRAGIYAVALGESLDIPAVRGFIDHLVAAATEL